MINYDHEFVIELNLISRANWEEPVDYQTMADSRAGEEDEISREQEQLEVMCVCVCVCVCAC